MNRFQFVADHQRRHGVKRLCGILGISRSSFYYWRRTADARAARQSVEDGLVARIRKVHQDSDGTYGAPRITAELRDQGEQINHKRVARIMRAVGIAGVRLRRRHRTTVADPATAKAPDLLGRDFNATEVNTKYVGDITYLPVRGSKPLYLATVIDLASRRLAGWAIADHMRTELVIDALATARNTRGSLAGAIMHTDHGSQYTSRAFAEVCRSAGVWQSMGAVGSSADNAAAESFNATFKRETRCYPVIWSPPEAPASGFEPYEDWFHSYVVTQMLESDDVAGAPVMRTDYRYLGGLSWAKGDDEFTKAKHRTWGERRGYGRVQTLTGDPAEGKQTLTEDRFFRGIDGAKVADSAGAEVADHESFAGQKRESAVYNGDGGSLVTATSYTPWHSTATATRSRTADNLPAVHARHTGVKKEETRTTIADSGTPRTTETTRTFDSYGMVDSVSESGDTAKTGDERCTTTDYHRNTGINLLDLVSETRTVAKPCGTTPSLPDDLMSATRTFYDGANDTSTAPTKGDITKEQEQDGAGTGFVTTSTAEYDAFGRQTKATDAAGATTTVAHTPATGQEPTKTVTTNDLGHVTTDISDPLRSVTTATVDPNGKRTDMEYDALGRLTKAWEPAWSKADHPKTPSAQFAYSVTRTKPTVTTSKTINRNGEYESSYTFYDGLLREREAQSTALGTGGKGRVVSETFYDTRGQAWKAYSPYYAEGAPTATLVTGDDTKVPAATEIRFDGAARATAALSLRYGDETRRTTSQYGGDRTTVIPPKGGTATTTLTDALGRTTEKRSYTDTNRNDYLATKYTYNTRGYLTKITNPRGTEWTWVHDHRGRQTESVDPDKGRSSTTYDTSDRPVSVTDARGTTLTTVYDALGRATQLKEGNTLRAAWSYDSVAKGQPADDTRYVDGKPYSTKINSYDDRYQVTQSTTTLPSSAGDLAGSYSWKFGYNAYTGATEWVLHPAIGNLPSERVTTVYGEGDLPVKTTAGQVTLVNNTAYDVFARPVRTEYGVLGRKVYRTSEFDEHTGLLNRRTIDGDVALRIDDTRYGYDPAGNVTRVSSTAGQGDAASTDTQCFGIDSLRRLTQAWTTKDPKDACNGAPSAGTVGGPDSYWHTYSYDDAGNRTKQVQHATGDTETVTSAYTTPGPGEARPHSLSSVTTAGGSDAGTESFAYDKAGNTTTRTGGSHDQALDWDPEGHLQKITENGKTTEYLYDSSGNRMQTKQADGSATAYLPAGNELTVTPAGAKEATRYYMHDGETVAVRNASGFSFLFGDHQATALIAVAFGVGQTVTRRKQLPFGGSRSSTGSADWPGDRGFLGGTSDPTGYTHLGAREYDPATGRFLSVDPLFLAADPTQHNGYQYGNNNPTTFADPTGEAYEECVSGQYHCSNGRTGGTGNITKVEFGKNYEKQTRAVGGKVSKNYYTQQATGVKFTYAKGRGTTKYTTAGESAGEKLRRKREAEHKRYLAQLKKERDDAEKKYKELQREVTFSEAISAMTLGNLKKVWNAYSSGNSVGRYLSVSIGVGAGGTGQACIVTTQRPDGKMDVGLSAGYGGEAPSVGFSAQYGMYGSNADDFEQLRGDGTGMNVSIGAGIAASVEHEKAINRVNGAVTPVLNSRGEPVSSTSLSIGVGAGFEAGVSSSYNNSILHLFTW